MSAAPASARERLQEVLVQRGWATLDQVRQAQARAVATGTPWETCLLEAGVSPQALHAARAEVPGSSPSLAPLPRILAHAAQLPSHTPVHLDLRPAPRPAPPAAAAPADWSPAPVAGPYQTVRVVGHGGMATVYLARHGGTGREVALKLMHPHLAHDPEFSARFVKESRASLGLRHPNVVEAVDSGEAGGQPYVAFEFVDSGTLEALLRKTGRLPSALALEVAAQVLSGLEYAHAQGVVHRDLKPANLLLSAAGVVKIADFGIAKTANSTQLTQTGARLGTPSYMSPEQAKGVALDARSDLYTVGVILFELLTGLNPFDAEHPGITLRRIIEGERPTLFALQPCVPARLDQVVESLMSVDPAARFPDARAALAALQPLREPWLARWPSLLADAVKDPVGVAVQVYDQDAEGFFQAAQELLRRTHAERPGAAFNLWRALCLDPDHVPARNLFEPLVAAEHYRFTPSENPKVLELEQATLGPGASPPALLQLAQLYRAEGNIHRAAEAFRRYLKARPEDGYVANQLALLTGEKLALGSTPRAAPVASGSMARAVPVAPGSMARGAAVGVARTPAVPLRSSGTGVLGPETADISDAPTALRVAAPAPASRPVSRRPVTVVEEPEVPAGRRALWWGLGALAVVLLLWGVQRSVAMVRQTVDQAAEASRAAARERAAQEREFEKAQQQALARADGELRAREAQGRLENGLAAFRMGDFAAASERFTDVVTRFAGTEAATAAELWRGKASLALHKDRDALDALTSFVAAHPESGDLAEAQLRKGEAQLRLGDAWAAVQTFRELLRDAPEGPWAQEALLLRGLAFAQRGQKDDAAADFRAVLAKAGPSSDLGARAKAALGE